MIRKLYLRDILLLSISAALLLGWLTTSRGSAIDSDHPAQKGSLLNENQITPPSRKFPTNTTTPTPVITNAINLPIVQQDASLQTREPKTSGEQTPLPSITPTPVPPQSIEDNAPIVLGAVVIVLIIILAWFIVGRRIVENRD